MNTYRVKMTAVIVLALLGGTALAQLAGVRRTELLRHDIAAPGREVVQMRVEIDAGQGVPKHTHPGDEVLYVVEGTLEYQPEGQPAVTLRPGQSVFIPAGTVHAARNTGSGNGAGIATYIAEKGKPLVTLVK